MLSYKQWKMLNESFAGSIALGLGTPTNLGLGASSGFGLDEAKMKKSKKKMDLDDSYGEMVDAGAPKDHPDVDVDMDDSGDDHDGGDDACGGGDGESKFSCKMSKKKSKKKMMKSKKKMWGDDDDDAGSEPDDEEGGDDAGMDDDSGDDHDDGEGHDDEGPAPGDKGGDELQFSKKKSAKKMKKEAYLDNDDEWLASVNGMMKSNPNQKYDDGFSRYYEDQLFTPVDTDNLTQAIRPEPQAGDVGFAPNQRIGG